MSCSGPVHADLTLNMMRFMKQCHDGAGRMMGSPFDLYWRAWRKFVRRRRQKRQDAIAGAESAAPLLSLIHISEPTRPY